jgi:cell division protein FtsZ
MRPGPKAQPAAQRGLRIERPRSEQAPTALPKRSEPQSRSLQVEMADAAIESPAEDDLEIPAFLRRRAN